MAAAVAAGMGVGAEAVHIMDLLPVVAWPPWVMGGVSMHRALMGGLTRIHHLLVTPRAATLINSLRIISVTITPIR